MSEKNYRRSRRSCSVTPVGESMTKSDYKDKCDLKRIVGKYEKLGMGLPLNQDQYADLTRIPQDLADAIDQVDNAFNGFMQLPSELRTHFGNDPKKFVTKLREASEDELRQLGVLPPNIASREPEKAPVKRSSRKKLEASEDGDTVLEFPDPDTDG